MSILSILWLLKLYFSLGECGILGSSVPKLIVISMDGFRYNYLNRFMENETSNFQYFIKNGVKAKYIRNVFPTVTYPNHYTLITGLYPESHGMVHNRFYDPNWFEHFWYDNRMDNFDPVWYDIGAEPIYVTNHKAGSNRRTGSVLWPAGLGKVKCVEPDYIIPNADPFNETEFKTRIDYLMKWFTDANSPINLGLLYFPEPDEIAHKFGPNSNAVNEMIKGPLNDALGYLKQKLEDADMLDSMNIILTADHGFAEVNKFINLDEYIDESWYEEASQWHNHVVVELIPKDGNLERIVEKLNHLPDLNIYRKGSEDLKRLHYNDNDRIQQLVLVGNEGVVIVNNKTKGNFTAKGMHGYRPDVRNMSPFFIAYGPAFKKGIVSEPFDSVDIYPLMCHILGLTPAPNNGSLDKVKHMLEEKIGLFDIQIPFSITAATFLIVVGISVTVAGIFAICTIIHARKKVRFLIPTSYRGAAEGQSQSHKLLEGEGTDTEDEL